ncbi:MAG: hypothetical protein K6A44_07430 [bacterium]|nr:hypothetical protein [bacterium]
MTEINRLGLNTSSIYNSSEPKTKPEGKDEAKGEAAPQAQTENHSLAPDDVLSYMAQTAAVTKANIEAQTQRQNPVEEFMSVLVGPTVEGLRELSNAERLEMAEAYRAANPGVDARMDSWMQAYDEEVGAFTAFLEE